MHSLCQEMTVYLKKLLDNLLAQFITLHKEGKYFNWKSYLFVLTEIVPLSRPMDSLLVSGLKDMHEHGAERNEHVDEINKTMILIDSGVSNELSVWLGSPHCLVQQLI